LSTLLFIFFETCGKEIFVTLTDGAAEKGKQNICSIMFMLSSCCCGISSHSQPSSWCKLSPQER